MRPIAWVKPLASFAIAGSLLWGTSGWAADITVGVILSATGPVASLGALEKNGVALAAADAPHLKLIYLDDASDPTQAAKHARKLITEDHVDVILGTTSNPGALAISPTAAEGTTPVVSQGPANTLVQPVDGMRRWIFKTTTNDEHEGAPLFAHMKAGKVKTVGFIGFTDSLGEQWARMSRRLAADNGLQIVAEERYARTDPSVASQVLKLLSVNPDAVMIAASGGAAATPLLELRQRGYKGRIYVTLGATFGDFLRIGGSAVEGVYAPFAAVMGLQYVTDDAVRAGAAEFVQAYEAKHGANTANIFAAGAWDAVHLIDKASAIALKKAQPGTPQFRAALRDALETIRGMKGARGIYTLSPTDHVGLDANALRVGRFDKGRWLPEPDAPR